MTRPIVIGIDGGGTSTRVAFADLDGRELARRDGPAGLIEPTDPERSAARLITLVRSAAAEAGVTLPARALCAGLAGAGAAVLRDAVRAALEDAGLVAPRRVLVVEDGEIALDGALGDEAGILLAAGTGSVAWGRAEDGRVARCGGWGRIVGDEGSAYGLVRDAIRAGLRGLDGRGEESALLAEILGAVGLTEPRALPPWLTRTGKAEVAALAPLVLERAIAGDPTASRVVEEASAELALHVQALLRRLGPWSGPVPLVLHGGLLTDPRLAGRVRDRLVDAPVRLRTAAADPVTAAVRRAVRAARA